MAEQIKIGGRLHSIAEGNVVTGANEILDDSKGKKQSVINQETDAELERLDNAKQNNLTFDTTPTEDSTNPITSGGVYAADAALQQAIEAILLLIPSAASALNQLADKAFVNSTVATDSATFRGTYNVVTDLELHYDATHQQIATALLSKIQTADNNDYCFVQIPVSDSSGDIRVTERYKFNGTVWSYEYDLNNSGFTAAQWAAINSTITQALVEKLGALPTAADLAIALNGKQNTLTFDTAPVAGSNNPVTSAGLYAAFAAINATIPAAASADNKLVAETRLAEYVAAIINALDATCNVTSTDGHVNVRLTQVDGVITSLEVLTSDIASAADVTALTTRVSTNEEDIALLQDAYEALTQSTPEIIEPTDTWPVAAPQEGVIYRVIDRVNTPPQYYEDYMYNGTAMVLMGHYNNAIDDIPTPNSNNLVKSGGVASHIVYDISEANAVGSTLATYADLAAALGNNGANIPPSIQKGGMSVKFVQSSDNKYIQARLMAQNFTTDVTLWQGCDSEAKRLSENLMESGGAYKIKQYADYTFAIGRIYTSSTDNYLDVENVLDNLRIVSHVFDDNNVGCIISRPVYVGDASVITISGYTGITKQVLFLSKAEYNNANIVTWYNLTDTQRTITVPTGALYAIVCLKNNSFDADYSSMKLSKSANVATQSFAPVYLGQAGQESLFAKTILTTDALADYSTPNANLPGKALSPQTKLQYMQTMSLDGKKLLAFNAVYGSTTDNYLDLNNLVYGLRIRNTSPYIQCHNDGITSRLIPVRGASKITVSGIGNIGPCALLFLDSIATIRTDWFYNLTDFTQRTIDVPSWANFIIIGLQYDASFAGGYANMKVSLSDVPATGEFSPRFVGYADNPESWDKPQEDDILTQSFIKKAEINETERRAIPFAFSSTYQSSPAANYQYERFNFLFFSDSHIDTAEPYSLQNVKDAISFVNRNKIPLKFGVHCGDVITPYGAVTKASQVEKITPFFDALKGAQLPMLFAVGNHDTNDWHNFPSNAFRPEDWDNLYFSWLRTNHGTIHNASGSFVGKTYQSDYYYKDFENEKVRVICLNNLDYPVGDGYTVQIPDYSGERCKYDGGHSFVYRQEQFDWLVNVALNFDSKLEKDWGVIICTHQTISPITQQWYSVNDVFGNAIVSKEDSSLKKMLLTLKALNTQSTYQNSYVCQADSVFNLNINADFTQYANVDKKPYIIGVFVGHEHCDSVQQFEGINMIWILNNSATVVSSDSRVARIAETNTQNAFDIVSIDLEKRKIYTTRYGAGLNAFGIGGDRFKPDGLSF